MKPKPMVTQQPEEASPPAARFEIVADSLRSGWQEARRLVSENSGPAAKKAGAIARVVISTGTKMRQVVGEGGAEIGGILGGETGKKIGSCIATVGLGWMLGGVLPPADKDQSISPLEDHVNGA